MSTKKRLTKSLSTPVGFCPPQRQARHPQPSYFCMESMQKRRHILTLHRIHPTESPIRPTLSNPIIDKPPNLLRVRSPSIDISETLLDGRSRRILRRTGKPVQKRRHILTLHRIHPTESPIRPTLSNPIIDKPPNLLRVRSPSIDISETLLDGRSSAYSGEPASLYRNAAIS